MRALEGKILKRKLEDHCLDVIKEALRHWDPIGVIDRSDPDSVTDNEYDSYAPGVLKYLEKGDNAKVIANHLAQIRSVSMGLGSGKPSEREDELGEKLIVWRESGYKEKPDFRFTRYTF